MRFLSFPSRVRTWGEVLLSLFGLRCPACEQLLQVVISDDGSTSSSTTNSSDGDVSSACPIRQNASVRSNEPSSWKQGGWVWCHEPWFIPSSLFQPSFTIRESFEICDCAAGCYRGSFFHCCLNLVHHFELKSETLNKTNASLRNG